MHTRLDIKLHGVAEDILQDACSNIRNLLLSTEMLLSCHHPDALAARLNHYNENSIVNIPAEFYDILQLAKAYYIKSKNLFDVTLGSGKFIYEENLTNFPKNIAQHTSTPFHFDFGGFGKGYALIKIKELLIKYNIPNAYLSFGGTSILCLGANTEHKTWKYSIPEFPHIQFKLTNESVSVSTNANPHGGSNHIIYPDTFKPADTNFVVAVKCKDALDAEILSTALVLEEMKGFQELIDAFPNSEAYIIDKIEPQNFLYLKSRKSA